MATLDIVGGPMCESEVSHHTMYSGIPVFQCNLTGLVKETVFKFADAKVWCMVYGQW